MTKYGAERTSTIALAVAALTLVPVVAALAVPFLVCALFVGLLVDAMQTGFHYGMIWTAFEMCGVLAVCHGAAWAIHALGRKPRKKADLAKPILLSRHR